MPITEYDYGDDDEIEESATATSNSSGDFAFARNNDFHKSNKRDNPFVPLESTKDKMEANEEENIPEEGQNFVAFLTTNEEVDGELYPVDYEKEYFGKEEDDEADSSKHYDGFVLPKEQEVEGEQRLNQIVNTGEDTSQEYPQSTSGEGAYWSESSLDYQEQELFHMLDNLCNRYPNIRGKEAIQYIMKSQKLFEMEAIAIWNSYVDHLEE